MKCFCSFTVIIALLAVNNYLMAAPPDENSDNEYLVSEEQFKQAIVHLRQLLIDDQDGQAGVDLWNLGNVIREHPHMSRDYFKISKEYPPEFFHESLNIAADYGHPEALYLRFKNSLYKGVDLSISDLDAAYRNGKYDIGPLLALTLRFGEGEKERALDIADDFFKRFNSNQDLTGEFGMISEKGIKKFYYVLKEVEEDYQISDETFDHSWLTSALYTWKYDWRDAFKKSR